MPISVVQHRYMSGSYQANAANKPSRLQRSLETIKEFYRPDESKKLLDQIAGIENTVPCPSGTVLLLPKNMRNSLMRNFYITSVLSMMGTDLSQVLANNHCANLGMKNQWVESHYSVPSFNGSERVKINTVFNVAGSRQETVNPALRKRAQVSE